MGSSSSKAARGAAGAARKYPTRAPGAVPPQATSRTKPQQPAPRGDGSKDDAIRADAIDPDFSTADFSRRLHQMGIVQPNPTYSPSSTAHLSPESLEVPAGPLFPAAKHNTTLSALEARRRLQLRADEDFDAMGRGGSRRRLVDMRTLLDAMELRDRGVPAADIEARLMLEPDLLSKLGPSGVISHIAAN